MTVKELIRRLEKVDGDLHVMVDGGDPDVDTVSVVAANRIQYAFHKVFEDKKRADEPSAIVVESRGIIAEISVQSPFDIFLENPEIEVRYRGPVSKGTKAHIESLRQAVLDAKKDSRGLL